MDFQEEVIQIAWNQFFDISRLRTISDIYIPRPNLDISRLYNATTLGTVINARPRPDIQAIPLCVPIYPPMQAYQFNSSTVLERVFMFIVARTVAERTGSLLCCTQLGKVSNEEKQDVLNPSINWETDEMLDKIARIMNKCATDIIPRCEIFKEAFSCADTLIDTILFAIGSNVGTDNIYLPARIDNTGAPVYDINGNERLPVLVVRPLRCDPHWHDKRAGAEGCPFEWQQMIIAGDILIVPYHSRDCSISFAHSIAIQIAAEHQVQIIRAIVTFDMSTNEVIVTNYYIPTPYKMQWAHVVDAEQFGADQIEFEQVNFE